MKKIKQEIRIAPSDANLTLAEIAQLWARWNGREISGGDFANGVERILKKETRRAWKEYNRPTSKDPLEKLLI